MDLLPHLILQQRDLPGKFPKMDIRHLILKILNYRVLEVRSLPTEYQTRILNKAREADLNQNDHCRLYSF